MLHNLLCNMVLLGATQFNVHSDGSLVVYTHEGVSPPGLSLQAEGKRVGPEMVTRIIQHLKMLCGVQTPSDGFPQQGEGKLRLHLGSVHESIYLRIRSEPAVHTPTEQHGEVLLVQVAVAPWLPVGLQMALPLMGLPVAFLLGLRAPGVPLGSWVWITLATILLSLTYPRTHAKRVFLHAQEFLFPTALLLSGFGVGMLLSALRQGLTGSLTTLSLILVGGIGHYGTIHLWRRIRPHMR